MSEILDIYQSPSIDQSVDREEERTYYPYVQSFNNSDEIQIDIHQPDAFICMSDSKLRIIGELKEEATTTIPVAIESEKTETSVAGECKLTNNAGLYLFESIIYSFNGKEVEKIRDPGTTTTIHNYCAYSANQSKNLIQAGWNLNATGHTILTQDEKTKKFEIWVPFSYIFGIFFYYRNVMFGHHSIRLVRSRNDDNAYMVTGSAKKATIKVHSVSIQAKHIYPSDKAKITLWPKIQTDKPITIGYRKCELHELPKLKTGTDKEIWSIKTTTNLETPRYIVLAFQTNIKDNHKKDVAKFSHINLRKYQAWVGSSVYPYADHSLDFTSNQYLSAYTAYMNLVQQLTGNSAADPIIDYSTFANTPLFVIDCSKQPEPLKASVVDIKLEFESHENFPESTKAYCLIIHDKIIEYRPKSEKVQFLI
ncbi:hypothetical protein Zmor_018569 [Zophobas morio]|uniref:Double jelly roll-like domain-containing protein n=1 Tax=Zophobas morio TaxID=2755281 RepID=A0AA38IEJ2_9CUCU|nr:hypothetical protein Zmor_018569 [Zophobas morio]